MRRRKRKRPIKDAMNSIENAGSSASELIGDIDDIIDLFVEQGYIEIEIEAFKTNNPTMKLLGLDGDVTLRIKFPEGN